MLAARFLSWFADPERGDVIVFHPPGVGDVPQRNARTEAQRDVHQARRRAARRDRAGRRRARADLPRAARRLPRAERAVRAQLHRRLRAGDRAAQRLLRARRQPRQLGGQPHLGDAAEAQRDRHGVRAVLAPAADSASSEDGLAPQPLLHPARAHGSRRARAGLRPAALRGRHLPRPERLDGAHAAARRSPAGGALLVLDRAADARATSSCCTRTAGASACSTPTRPRGACS